MRRYLDVLFDSGSLVCPANSLYDVALQPAALVGSDAQWISVNSFTPGTKRLDRNVNCFRNFLIEFDKISLEEQDKLVTETGLPWSTKVFSGGKSYHYVISLEEPCANEEEYRELAGILIDVIYKPYGVDRANKYPSRFTRVPGTVRPDTGQLQELIEVRERISTQRMLEFLDQYKDLIIRKRRAARKSARIREAKREAGLLTRDNAMENLNPRTKAFLETGAVEGDRHHELNLAACDLRRNGLEVDEIEAILDPIAWSIGIGDRGDLQGILNWVDRNVLPEVV